MNIDQFDAVFGPLSKPFPYDSQTIKTIDGFRRTFNGQLFIDRVLTALGQSKANKLYPPKSENTFRQLHETITRSTVIHIQHKLSVLYYLILDMDELIPSEPPRAPSFATRAGVPSTYQTFITGLWFMDRHDFASALQHLTDPSLTPEFADDVLLALCRHATIDGDFTLPLAYWHGVQPVLKDPVALDVIFKILAQTNVSEALDFSRARPDNMREELFKKLVLAVLEGSPNDENAENARLLVGLPLDRGEERWFEEALTSGEGKRMRGARDTFIMRRLARGDLPQGGSGEKGAWGVVMEGFRAGSGGRS